MRNFSALGQPAQRRLADGEQSRHLLRREHGRIRCSLDLCAASFVNGVLQQMRDDGRLATLFTHYGLPTCENPANNIECTG